MTDFREKVVFVTGAASGVGRATCKRFANDGAHVIAADINEQGARKTAGLLPGEHMARGLDVSRESEWAEAIDKTLAQFGRLDVLVNCAGIGRNGNFEELSLDDWNAMIAVNLTGTFLGCKHGMRAIRESGGGVIVNISSIGGLVGGADIAGYCASKGGVTVLTKAAAMHGAPHGVRVCAVAPTYIDSEMLDDVAQNFPNRQAMLDGMAELVPVGRIAKPEDIANVIAFLASDDAAMMTGSTVMADGGQLAGIPSRHAGH